MQSYPSPLVTDRWAEWEARLARLEALMGSGLLGTDQTIKGSHDRLDTILGSGYVQIGSFWAAVADNTPTTVFTIATTNEAGNNDGGTYVVWLFARVTHGSGQTSTAAAAKTHLATFAHVNINTGAQTNSAVTEIAESASAANDGATVDIGAVTCSLTTTGDTVTNVQYTVDGTGTGVTTLIVRVWALLIWVHYATAPVMASA